MKRTLNKLAQAASALKPSALLERGIAAYAPGWAFKRKDARLRLNLLNAYEADQVARDTENMPTTQYSATAAQANKPIGDARGRASLRNSALGKSIIGGYKRKIVGTGITARSAARDWQSGKPRDEFNRELDAWWSVWCQTPEYVDRQRCMTAMMMQQLQLSDWITVGQSFTLMSYEKGRDDMVGLTLQALETEQLDTSLTQAPGSRNRVIHGIEIDRCGAAVAYWFHTKEHPLDEFTDKPQRIPADRVLHLYSPERCRQIHGDSKFSAVLKQMFHVDSYNQYTLLSAQLQACGGAAIMGGKSGGGIPRNLDAFGVKGPTDQPTTDDNGNTIINWEPGHLWDLRGLDVEDLKYFEPRSPGEFHQTYNQTLNTVIAAGAGLDYATMLRDFSQGTYASQRQGLLETYQETDPMILIMIDKVWRKIRNAFIYYAIIEGRIQAPGYFTDARTRMFYQLADWQGPPKPWISPKDEAMAAKIALEYKLKTRRELINLSGGDVNETMRQSGDEIKLARENGIILPDDKAAEKGIPNGQEK